MKFVSYFKKLKIFSTKLLVLSTLSMIAMSITTGYFVTKTSNVSLNDVIFNTLEVKAKLQLINVKTAMVGLLEENAFSGIEVLFTSVLKNDEDFIYANFIDLKGDRWLNIDESKKKAKISKSTYLLFVDTDSLLMQKIETDSFPIITFLDAVINSKGEKLGYVEIILSTKKMSKIMSDSQKLLIESNVMVSFISIVSFLIILFFVGQIISKKFARNLTTPILELEQIAKEVSLGNYDVQIDIVTNDEIGQVAIQFGDMITKIKHFQEQAVEDAQVGKEMEIAKNIQTALLPDTTKIKNIGYEFSTNMIPAEEVGGDYYDIIHDSDGRLWIGIGDVTGHGLVSGLVMMMTQVAINTILKNIRNVTPTDLMIFINRIIHQNIRDGLKVNHHMTICFLLEKSNGEFLYAGAHETIMIYRAKSKKIDLIETKGMWIGIIPEITKQIVKGAGEFSLNEGDICLLYTDGVTEIKNDENEQFGLDRLVTFLQLHAEDCSVDQLNEKLINDLNQFKKEQLDDITFVIFKKSIEKLNNEQSEEFIYDI